MEEGVDKGFADGEAVEEEEGNEGGYGMEDWDAGVEVWLVDVET